MKRVKRVKRVWIGLETLRELCSANEKLVDDTALISRVVYAALREPDGGQLTDYSLKHALALTNFDPLEERVATAIGQAHDDAVWPAGNNVSLCNGNLNTPLAGSKTAMQRAIDALEDGE